MAHGYRINSCGKHERLITDQLGILWICVQEPVELEADIMLKDRKFL